MPFSSITSVLHACRSFLRWAFCHGPWWRRAVAWFIGLILAFVLFLLAVDNNFLWLFGKSPTYDRITHPVNSEASEIYSSDSVLLGRFFSENRTPVKYEEISPIVIRTLIATEDERFYHHHGIDVVGLFAATKDIFRGHARGASTITQQLAKNLFRVRTQYSTGLLGYISGVKLLVMKFKEWIVATKLEWAFTKDEILTMYFNTVDFGSNSYGIKTAARTFFGTTPDRLTYEQAATLVGLLKATSAYSPRLHPDNARVRRNVVLQNLYDHGGIIIGGEMATQKQLDSLMALPVRCVEYVEESSYDGLAPYFRTHLKDYIEELCDMGLVRWMSNSRIDLYADGLKIYTTLDTRLQQYAEAAVMRQMRYLQQRFDEHWAGQNPWQDENHHEIQGFIEDIARRTERYQSLAKRFNGNEDSISYYMNLPRPTRLFSYDGPITRDISTMDSIRYMVSFLHCGFVAIEPDTRYVRAWVGDIDFDSWKYDKVTSMRQPGSTFKLFVYTEAMNQGMTPCTQRIDQWSAYVDSTKAGNDKAWVPHNASGHFSGAVMPLKTAFARSINSIAVKLGNELGIRNVIRTAQRMGIKSPLDEVPALSLGCSDVTLLELVNSYCTVMADGKYNMPLMVERIEDRDGHVIYRAEPNEQQAISYRSAFLMQMMLRSSMLISGGTTGALWEYINPVANMAEFGGKTGTSNNYSDAWFVGVSPGLVAGSWVGGEYRSIHFRTSALGQGSRTALPIFGRFMASTLADKRFSRYRRRFAPPQQGIDRRTWECASTNDITGTPFEGITIEPLEGISLEPGALSGSTAEKPTIPDEPIAPSSPLPPPIDTELGNGEE